MNHLLSLRLFACTALIGILGFTGCSSSPEPSVTWALTGTVWMVAELEGEMVGAKKIPTLQLEAGGQRVHGFGGINRLTGNYRLEGATLSFGPLASTRMAGEAKQMEVEAHFLRILGLVTHYQAQGPWLVLLAGDKVVARAQATPAVPFAQP